MTQPTPEAPPQAVRTLARQPPPPGIYASKYDPELALMICVRIAAGESVQAICRADPAMPTEKTVWNWAQAHPEFAEMRAAAIRTARAARRQAQAARRAAPSKTGRRAWNRGRDGYDAEIAEAICDRIALAEPLYKLCRDPAMPSVGTVYNWLRDHPEFLAAYRGAKAIAFAYVIEGAMEDAPWLGGYGRSMAALARIERAALRRCGWLAPKGLAAGTYEVWPPRRAARGDGLAAGGGRS